MKSDFSDGALDGLVGQQVGRFLVQARLGSGGVATVYRALDQVDEVEVALKMLPPGSDADALTRLRREAITAGMLRHPNIVRTLQVGTPTAALTAEGQAPAGSPTEDTGLVIEVITTQVTATATLTVPAETAAPEPTWTPTPVATPSSTATLAPQLFDCPAVIDPFFQPYLGGLAASVAERFICPTGNAVEAGAVTVRFEHGFMLQLDNEPTVLIYYDLNQEWERVVGTWQAGDPPPAADIPPPAPDLYRPQGVFGQLWATPQRMAALGFATTPEPNRFSAVSQSFDGGALIGNRETGAVNLHLREKLRL